VARRLQGLIGSLAAASPGPVSTNTLELDGSARLLRSSGGQPRGRSLVAARPGGALVLSPGAELAAGSYRAVLEVHCELVAGALLRVEVAAYGGSKSLARRELRGPLATGRIELPFVLRQARTDVRVQLQPDALTHVSVLQLSLQPVQDSEQS
jgi:hypothetical protein